MVRLFRRNVPRSRWDSDGEVFEEPEPFELPDPINPDFYDPGWDEWGEPNRKVPRIIFVSVAAVVVLVAALIILKPYLRSVIKPGVTTTPVATGIHIEASPFVVKAGTNAGPPIHWEGSGAKTTDPHSLTGGLYVLRYQCNCNGLFAVTILDETSTVVSVPVNVINAGNEAGTIPITLPDGNYRIKVLAKGTWSVGVEETAGAEPVALPLELTLAGSAVVGPFPASTAVEVRTTLMFPLQDPASIRTMDEAGKITGEVVQARTIGTTTAKVEPQPAPFYLVASGTPQVWFIGISQGS